MNEVIVVESEAGPATFDDFVATRGDALWRSAWLLTGDSHLAEDLVTALATLPRGQRAMVVLRYFEDLTEKQTAELLGCSVGTVKSQTARALRTLRISPLLAQEDR